MLPSGDLPTPPWAYIAQHFEGSLGGKETRNSNYLYIVVSV